MRRGCVALLGIARGMSVALVRSSSTSSKFPTSSHPARASRAPRGAPQPQLAPNTRSAAHRRPMAEPQGRMRSILESGSDAPADDELRVVARALPGTPSITIFLYFGGPMGFRGFVRPRNEEVGRVLQRISIEAAKIPEFCPPGKAPPTPWKKGKKGNKGRQEGPLPKVELREGFATVDPSTTNDVAWRPPRSLVIAGRVAQITRDPPTVTELTTTAGGASPIPGVPVAAVARLAFADERFTTITWHLQSRAPPSPSPSPNGSKAAAPAVAWREVGRGSEYVPDAADAGCRLFVHATPSDGIVSGALQRADAGVVAAAPARLPGEGRHSLTPAPLASPGLRVMTYNILADQYASSTYAKTTLFGYCAPAALEIGYRRQLVLQEILGFHCDVVALQECDEKTFSLYEPVLRGRGYEGRFAKKAGPVTEGCATFWRTSRFTLVDSQVFAMRGLVDGDCAWGGHERYAFVRELAERYPHLRKVLEKVTTVLQLLTLAPVSAPDHPLVLGNTHLFFHPRASHVRSIHAYVMADLIRRARDEAVAEGKCQERPAVVWCGDFNSDLNDGLPSIPEMLQYGRLSGDYWDWKDIDNFTWGEGKGGGGEEDSHAAPGDGGGRGGGGGGGGGAPGGSASAAQGAGEGDSGAEDAGEEGEEPWRFGLPDAAWVPEPLEWRAAPSLDAPLRLFAAGGMRAPWTNYVRGYKGLLDHVWLDNSTLEEVREIPLPDERAVTREVALPSTQFPSDHLSVVFDFAWRPRTALMRVPEQGVSEAAVSERGAGAGEAGGAGDAGPSSEDLQHAYCATLAAGVCALSAGEAVAVPGMGPGQGHWLCCDATDDRAVSAMRRLTGLPPTHPLHVAFGTPTALARHMAVPASVAPHLETLLEAPCAVQAAVRTNGEAGATGGDATAGGVEHSRSAVQGDTPPRLSRAVCGGAVGSDHGAQEAVGFMPSGRFASDLAHAYGRPLACAPATVGARGAAGGASSVPLSSKNGAPVSVPSVDGLSLSNDGVPGLRVVYEDARSGEGAGPLVDIGGGVALRMGGPGLGAVVRVGEAGAYRMVEGGAGAAGAREVLTAAGLVEE